MILARVLADSKLWETFEEETCIKFLLDTPYEMFKYDIFPSDSIKIQKRLWLILGIVYIPICMLFTYKLI